MIEGQMAALTALEKEAKRELHRLNWPAPGWVSPSGPSQGPDLDVLIVGAGMCGQTAAFALLREGVRHFRIV